MVLVLGRDYVSHIVSNSFSSLVQAKDRLTGCIVKFYGSFSIIFWGRTWSYFLFFLFIEQIDCL